MIRRNLFPLFCCLAIALLSLPALAESDESQTLAYWNFDDETLDLADGRGELRHNFTSITYYRGTEHNVVDLAGGSADATPTDDDRDEPNQSLAVVGGSGTGDDGTGGNNGSSLYFLISTRAHEALEISLAARRSSTGFSENHLAYSIDGGESFTPLDASFKPEEQFTEHRFDLSDVRQLDNQGELIIRIVFTGATHAQGNNRLDNIHFTATPRGGR